MSTLFSDDFNRADGGLGANYTVLAAGLTISSNQVAGFAGDGSVYYNGGSPAADCWTAMKYAVKSAVGGNIGLRLNTGTFNGYTFRADTGSSTAAIQRLDAGVPTALGAAFANPSDGAVVRLEVRGSTVSVYYDDVLQVTRSDAAYSAAGVSFLSGNGTALRFDDFGLGSLPTISSATPSGTLGTTTTATIGCTTDDNTGTLYVVVDTASLAGITESQIKAGQNASSAAADASGSSSVSGLSPSVGVTGLSPSTAYNYAVLQFSGGNSNILTGTFTTATPIMIWAQTLT